MTKRATKHPQAVDLEARAMEMGVAVVVDKVPAGGWEMNFTWPNVGVHRAKTMQQAVDLLKQAVSQRKRVINVTVIDAQGSPTTTQVDSVGFDGAAMDYLKLRVERGLEKGQTWYKPAIYAFMFDNTTKELRRYSIDEDGAKIDRVTTAL